MTHKSLIGHVEVRMDPCSLILKKTVQKAPSSVVEVGEENACHLGRGGSNIDWMSDGFPAILLHQLKDV